MKAKLLFIFFISIGLHSYSQCGKALVELAKSDMKPKEVLLNQYFVCLSKSWNYTNIARYAMILNKGIKYRFIIKNSPDYEGKAVLRFRYLGDVKSINNIRKKTYDLNENFVKDKSGDTDSFHSFAFEVDKSGVYQLHVSFMGGKDGCAAVLLVYQK